MSDKCMPHMFTSNNNCCVGCGKTWNQLTDERKALEERMKPRHRRGRANKLKV